MTVLSPAPSRLRVEPSVTPGHALELLSDMAVALGHDVDVDFLLAELASGVRQTLGADRVSVLLLDAADRLSPAVAVARQSNDDLWQRFRQMPPIALGDLPGARQALAQGNVLVIDDASTSPLVPAAWQRTFQLDSLAIAPLLVADEPAGLVAVEYAQQSGRMTPTQLALLEGMAALAGIALRGAVLRRRSQRTETISGLVREIATARTPRAIAEHALPVLLETAGVAHGLFALLEADVVDVIAVRGPHLPEPGRYALTSLPTDVVARCRATWATDPRGPVAAELDGRVVAVVPIAGSSATPKALAVLPVDLGRLPYDVIADVQLIADATAMALYAVRIAADRDWHLRLAASMSTAASAPVRPSGIAAVVREAQDLLAELGLGESRLVVERAVARATGLPAAPADVARQLAKSRRPRTAPVSTGEESGPALRADGRIVGALLWRGGPGDAISARAELVLTHLGDVLGRAAARERGDELEHNAAAAEAHAAVAARAYREAGQVLKALSDELRGAVSGEQRIASSRLLAEQARGLVRHATEALAPTTARQPSLRTALTSQAQQMYAHGGPETVIRQAGRLPSLDPGVQVAVVRATQRVLSLLREARAAAALVHLDAVGSEVRVSIRAEELLTSGQDAAGPQVLVGLRDAQAWVSAVGGSLDIVHDGPVSRLVVRAPAGLRRPERPSPAPGQRSREVVVPLM
ncbi:MAG: GAF domain-containing protein [Frankiaceae bacterium]|nr:GAF domain-containing protein [Frankiaceae bacterium]